MDITTKSLVAQTSQMLSWLEGYGFKYFKSYEHYRRKNENGYSYIAINSITHNGTNYHLAFYISVRIDRIEEEIKKLYGEDMKLNHYSRTIWSFTVNIGPGSPHWDYPIRGGWEISCLQGLETKKDSINEFINDLALPYVTEHMDPLAIRDTLIHKDGHSQTLYPYEQILAIDLLFGTKEQVVQDIDFLKCRYKTYAKKPMARLNKYIELVSRRLE